MLELPKHLFVYGTLHPDRAPEEIRATARQLRSAGPATVRGTLYDLGSYPGLVIPGPMPRSVHGELFLLPNGPEALIRLDAYEDFRQDDPAGSLFLRVITEAIRPGNKRIFCWTYTFNGTPNRIISP